jgi:hypothetical protein
MRMHRHVFLFCDCYWRWSICFRYLTEYKMKSSANYNTLHYTSLRCVHSHCNLENLHICSYSSALSNHATTSCLLTSSCMCISYIYLHFSYVISVFPFLTLHIFSWHLLPPALCVHASCFPVRSLNPFYLHVIQVLILLPFHPLLVFYSTSPPLSQYCPVFCHIIELTR